MYVYISKYIYYFSDIKRLFVGSCLLELFTARAHISFCTDRQTDQ